MKRFKHWLIRLLGGHLEPQEPKKVYMDRTTVRYRTYGRPFDLSDWQRLASMESWGEEFFRFLEFELNNLDDEEARLQLGPDKDRDRLSIAVRRRCLKDLQGLPDRALKRVVAAANELETEKKKKGLSNHGT